MATSSGLGVDLSSVCMGEGHWLLTGSGALYGIDLPASALTVHVAGQIFSGISPHHHPMR